MSNEDETKVPPPSSPTTVDEIKPMRLEKAIRHMTGHIDHLETVIEKRIAQGLPVGRMLAEMAAVKALLLAVGAKP